MLRLRGKPKEPEIVPDKTVLSFGTVDVMVRKVTDAGDRFEVYWYDPSVAVYYMVDAAKQYEAACDKAKRHAAKVLKEAESATPGA